MRDGHIGVPTDAVIPVLVAGTQPVSLASVIPTIAGEYRLRGPSGKLVEIDRVTFSNGVLLRPKHGLEPRSSYIVEHVFAYTAKGELMSDALRAASVESAIRHEPDNPESPIAHRMWYPELELTTGDSPSTTSVEPPQARRISLNYGGCGKVSFVSAEYEAGSTFDGYSLIGIELEGKGIIGLSSPPLPNQREHTLFLGAALCLARSSPEIRARFFVILDKGTIVHGASWLPVAVSGARIESAPPAKAVASKRPQPLTLGGCGTSKPVSSRNTGDGSEAKAPRPFFERFAELYTKPPIEPSLASKSISAGPRDCRYGFVPTTIAQTPGDRALSALGVSEKGYHFLASTATASSFVTVHENGTTTSTTLDLRVAADEALFDDDGFIAMTSGWVTSGAGFAAEVTRFDHQGSRVWSQTLPDPGSEASMARAPDRILIAWLVSCQNMEDCALEYVILDAGDGRLLSRTRAASRVWRDSPAVRAEGDSFRAAWLEATGKKFQRKASKLAWQRIDLDGRIGKAHRIPTSGFPLSSLTFSTGERPTLAFEEGYRVQVVFFDPNDRPSKPIVVDTGTSRGGSRLWLIELPTFMGMVWASSELTYAVALDPKGRVSPALPIRYPYGTRAIGRDGQIIVLERDGSSFWIERLSCRQSPPKRPPLWLYEPTESRFE